MTTDTDTPDDASVDARRPERPDTIVHEEVLLEKPMLTARIVFARQSQT
jgi:hypothetical protein